VALLLPAIQAAREAARRAKCQSNLHNLALACLNYEATKKHLPQGFISTGPTAIESWGWGVFILPYIEEQAVYDQLRPSETFEQTPTSVDGTRKGKRNLADVLAAAATNAKELVPLQTPIAVFHCPSDSTPDLVPCDRGGGKCSASNNPAGPQKSDQDLWYRSFREGAGQKAGGAATDQFLPSASNYVGNKGIQDNQCPGSSSNPWIMNDLICAGNGTLFANSNLKMSEISDGTGKTFLLGERDRFCMAATWIGARNPVSGGEMHSSLWTVAHTWLPLNYPWTADYNTCVEGFSSAHKGGGFFAFVDGSVHFITDDISSSTEPNGTNSACTASKTDGNRCLSSFGGVTIGVYQRLSWRDDGEQIDNTSF